MDGCTHQGFFEEEASSASIAEYAEVITAFMAALRKPFDSNVSTAAIVIPPVGYMTIAFKYTKIIYNFCSV